MSLASINIKFQVDLKQFSDGMQNSLREIDKFGKKMQSAGKSLSTYLTLPLIAAGAGAVALFDKQAKAVAQVEAGLKTTGNQAGFTSEKLQKMATDLQNNSLFGDEDILGNVTAQLLTFTNIAGDQFDRTQLAALNLATRLGGDLKSASIQLGKALNDPVANLSALSRSGIQFSKDQKALINSLAETGRLAEAQTIILNELDKQYGGSAQAAAEAGAGGIKQLSNSFGDLMESFGEIINEGIKPFVLKLKEMVQGFQDLSPSTKKIIVVVSAFAAALGPLLVVVGAVASAIPAVISGFSAIGVVSAATLLPVLAIVAGLTAIAYVVVNNWEPIKKQLAEVANYFVDLYNNSILFRGAIESTILVFRNMFAVAKLVFNNILATVNFVGQNIFNFFKTLGNLVKAVLTFDLNGLKTALATGFSTIGKDAVSFFNKLSSNSKQTADEIGDNITTALKNTFSNEKLPKIIIAKDKVDATAIANAVADAIVTGATGKINIASSPKVKPLENTLQSTGLADLQAPKIGPIDFEFQKKAVEDLSERMLYLQEVGYQVGASVSDAFGALSSNIVNSLGLASNGFEGFVGGLVQTITKLIAMMLASSISQSIAGATASGTATGPAAIFTTPAFIATAVGGILAAFASIPKFETGGVVGGSSYYGDKILARVNSSELILNANQQKSLYGQMSGGSGVQIIPNIVFRGADMLIMFERAQALKNRLT
jgi:hypothetical protein